MAFNGCIHTFQTVFITPGVLPTPGSVITTVDKNRCPMHTHALKVNGKIIILGVTWKGCVRAPVTLLRRSSEWSFPRNYALNWGRANIPYLQGILNKHFPAGKPHWMDLSRSLSRCAWDCCLNFLHICFLHICFLSVIASLFAVLLCGFICVV